MSDIDNRIYNAIKKLDEYFGNKKYIICGSVSLYLLGIKLNREPHDFDIIIQDKETYTCYRFFRLILKQSGFYLDFPDRLLKNNENIITINVNGISVLCLSKEDILKCKLIIIKYDLFKDREDAKNKLLHDIEIIQKLLDKK